MTDVIASVLTAAYATYGVAAVFTPGSGTGPVACVAIAFPAVDDVATLLRVGDRAPGYRCRLRQAELATRPRAGDVLSMPGEGLTLRVREVETSLLDVEWLFTAVPSTGAPGAVSVGHLQPPLLGGWAWA